ncbi:MAG: hypothetical protein KatS3mg108_0823 [Isosphaeraceae bacterium]|jgi:hypothetical protein|nr:MAG: hypothetical protein KatS3mg108_0823 [Isosphaeraceae bacterium]
MSGPIVRKYGFPNYEAIFGKKEIEHGIDEPGEPREEAPSEPAAQPSASKKAPSKRGKKSST